MTKLQHGGTVLFTELCSLTLTTHDVVFLTSCFFVVWHRTMLCGFMDVNAVLNGPFMIAKSSGTHNFVVLLCWKQFSIIASHMHV